jgi:hypothetical protein
VGGYGVITVNSDSGHPLLLAEARLCSDRVAVGSFSLERCKERAGPGDFPKSIDCRVESPFSICERITLLTRRVRPVCQG